jgi:hypothetical protein
MEKISSITNFFVDYGVPLETVELLLMLPIVVTVIAFFRQVVGIKAFGIYTPSIITFAFFEMGRNYGVSGIKYGVAIFVSVIVVGMVSRFFLEKLRILYLPRVAITLTIVALVMLVLLTLGGSLKRTGLAATSIFPLLVMITLVEKFVTAQMEKGNRTALMLAGETLIISLVGYGLVQWEALKSLIALYPWVILLTIPINFALGRWTGLRLSEYLRFRKIFKHL